MSVLLMQVFDSLKNDWTLTRTISHQGIMHGTAHFKLIEPNTLHYQEHGIFTSVTGASFNTTREYFYYYDNRTAEISVFFVENNQRGKLLHSLQFIPLKLNAPLRAKAKHICSKDVYSATYEFNQHGQFSLRYQVKGPAKDYVINTLYKK